MNIYDTSWEIFSKTGDIDAYLLYKTGEKQVFGSGINGEHKDERIDTEREKLR